MTNEQENTSLVILEKKDASVVYYYDLIQGSEEWFAARCGLLTASEMKLVITPSTLKAANNDKVRAHAYELAAQRLTKYVEPSYIGDDMLRGIDDEILAKILYAEKYAPVTDVGFVTNNKWGFKIGCSPDGLVGDDGIVECKSRKQKFQIETIIGDKMPDDFLIQVQTGLMVTGRKWTDFISYCGGLPMLTTRVIADVAVQEAILAAAAAFEATVTAIIEKYRDALTSPDTRLIPTERKIIEEMHL